MGRHARVVLAGCVAALLCQALRAAEAKPDFERWFSVLIDDKPIGWVHATVESAGSRITTAERLHYSVAHGGVNVVMDLTTTVVETPEGKPVEATLVQKFGLIEMTQTMTFHGDKMDVTVKQAGQTRTSTVDAPRGKWLTPEAARRYVLTQMAAGATEIKCRTIDPAAGTEAFEMDAKVLGDRKVQVTGKVVPASEWEVTLSNMPGLPSRWFMDSDGHQVKSTMPAGGMTMTVLEADKQVATAGVAPPEIMVSTLIRPDKPIARPREAESAVFELKIAEPKAGQPDPEIVIPRGGSQRVVWADKRTARVVIDLSQPLNPGTDLPTEADSASSAMVNAEDAEVKKLMGEAVKGLAADAPAGERAEAMRKFVYRYIKNTDLAVGFASASEVARTAEGDCSEHAVLLAGLLRAGKVPARLVSGLVYVNEFAGKKNVFGYHMWTQAWLGDAGKGFGWVDLDATLSRDHPFDATHIALGVTSMADAGVANDMMQLVPLIGRLSVVVVEVKP